MLLLLLSCAQLPACHWSQAVAGQRPKRFHVCFRDLQGEVTQAADLDVYVRPAGHAQASSTDSNLSAPLSLEDIGRLRVGPRPLAVRSGILPSAPRIGQLMPGARLRVLKLEAITEQGLQCACVMLRQDDDNAEAQSWRALYAHLPDWRARTWRDQVRQEKEINAREEAMRDLAQQEAAEAARQATEKEEERRQQRLREQAEAEAKVLAEARGSRGCTASERSKEAGGKKKKRSQ